MVVATHPRKFYMQNKSGDTVSFVSCKNQSYVTLWRFSLLLSDSILRHCTYQLSFSSKTMKSRANSSTSFFKPKDLKEFRKKYINTVVHSLCLDIYLKNHRPALEYCTNYVCLIMTIQYKHRSTHLAQLRRQITSGPIRPLYRSWQEEITLLAHACGLCICVCRCVHTLTTSTVE